jgi:starch phosphorylase
MVKEYVDRFYKAAGNQWRRHSSDEFAGARALAAWKARIRAAWSGVALRRLDSSPRRISYGDSLRFEVAVDLKGLAPEDITVEVLFGRPGRAESPSNTQHLNLVYQERLGGSEHLYALDLTPELCGRIEYRIRAYPAHELLTHPFEMGMMRWL